MSSPLRTAFVPCLLIISGIFVIRPFLTDAPGATLLEPGQESQAEKPDLPKECSFLYEPAYCLDHCLRGEARAYMPHPGDILLATDPDRFWTITHNLAFAFEPHNS